jgi:hypothetical protein
MNTQDNLFLLTLCAYAEEQWKCLSSSHQEDTSTNNHHD